MLQCHLFNKYLLSDPLKDLTNRKGEESHLGFLVQFSMGIEGTSTYHLITYLSMAFYLFLSISFSLVECLLYARPKKPGMFSHSLQKCHQEQPYYFYLQVSPLRHSEMQQTSYISKMVCVVRELTDEARES